MPQESIVDTSHPSAGRIYDYLLGGSHNFDVDRQAAEQLRVMLPFINKAARLQRWGLQDLAVELTERRGFDVIIDFASGLPTNDHIHYMVPKGTTVIYSDYDPVVVEYAHEILAGTPNVYFFQADARQPMELLQRPEVETILQGRRDVALVIWGVSSLMPDRDLHYAAQALYDWSGNKSCLAYNAQGADENPNDPAMIRAIQIYEEMGTPFYLRPLDKHRELMQPWRPDANGFISLLEWHGFDQSEMAKEDVQAFGPLGGGYGAYLIK
jgi:hypothetical protein